MRVCTTPDPADNLYVRKLCTALADAGAEISVLTVRGLVTRDHDIVHLHWPEWQLRGARPLTVAWRAAALLGGLAVSRLRGARVVWTVHNVEPHESTPPLLSRPYWWLLTSMVDGVISPSHSGVGRLRRRHPRLATRPTAVIPIGHLRGEYPDHGSRELARRRLGIADEATVLVCFGLIRRYKGVPALIRAVRAIDDPDVVLLVAGRPVGDVIRREVEQAAGDDPRIRLRLEHVPDDDVQDVLRAGDVVVLPYARSSNSFVALLALSFERPIVAPAIGAFPDLADQFSAAWIQLYEGDITPEVLLAARDRAREAPPAPLDLEPFDWAGIATSTIDFFAALQRRRAAVSRATSRR